jgi:hypothetical protein
MRSTVTAFVIPPFNDDVFPYHAFPPWMSLRRACSLVAAERESCATPTRFKHLDVALVQAAQRIAAVARGQLPLPRWYRRVIAAVRKLDHAKLAIIDLVAGRTLGLETARAVVDNLDLAVAQLADHVARVPLPDDLRTHLADIVPSSRAVP